MWASVSGPAGWLPSALARRHGPPRASRPDPVHHLDREPDQAELHDGVVQQLMLMEASLSQDQVTERMHALVQEGVPLLFGDFWLKRWDERLELRSRILEITECLRRKKDPAKCFDLDDHDWFDDPFDYHPGFVAVGEVESAGPVRGAAPP